MKKNEVSITKYILISIIILFGSIFVSEITRILLLGDIFAFEFSEEAASLVASILQSTVSAIAVGFVLYQLKLGDKTEEKQSDIAEGEFILHYNQAFIGDSQMCGVESILEKRMETGEAFDITSENRQAMINYLVYLEGLAPLVFRDVIKLEHIDDLMAYRFFLSMNTPELQADQLIPYADYYRGCFKLYELWKGYRLSHGYPILQKDFALDRWPNYDLYSDSEINVRPYHSGDKELNIARLIYNTDSYIYPAAFGSEKELKNNLAKMIGKETGIFAGRNIAVAEINKKIVGVVVYVSDKNNLEIDECGLALPVSFDDVNKRYFKKIVNEIPDNGIYIACVSVDKCFRNRGVGEALMRYILRQNPEKKLRLDVLAENFDAIKLYEKFGFRNGAGIKEGYSYKSDSPKCISMEYTYIP